MEEESYEIEKNECSKSQEENGEEDQEMRYDNEDEGDEEDDANDEREEDEKVIIYVLLTQKIFVVIKFTKKT